MQASLLLSNEIAAFESESSGQRSQLFKEQIQAVRNDNVARI